MVNVRLANEEDASSLLQIYAPHVLTNAITFETAVPTVNDFKARIQTCLQKFAWLLCEVDGRVAGYVYASSHRERAAYQWSCDCSVYVNPKYGGKRIGRTLYQLLFAFLKAQGIVNVYAGITLPNEASVRLHESCGFRFFALYENVGYKLGAWHNVGWWKLQLNDHPLEPLPPLLFSQLDPLLVANEINKAAAKIAAAFQQ